MTREALERAFATRGIRRGGLLLLSATEARAFVAAARDAQLPVLGIDAIRVEARETRPDLAQILDLSDATPSTDTWAEAEAFLAARLGSGLHFDVVLGNGPVVPEPPAA